MSEEDLDSLLGSVFGEPPNGKKSNFDGNWSRDSVLAGLRVPPEFLNPLCSTLRKFDYFDDWGFIPDPFTVHRFFVGVPPASLSGARYPDPKT